MKKNVFDFYNKVDSQLPFTYGELYDLMAFDDLKINYQNEYGTTALMQAIAFDQYDIVELLLKHDDIDVTLCDNKDNDALFIARKFGNLEIIELLEEYY